MFSQDMAREFRSEQRSSTQSPSQLSETRGSERNWRSSRTPGFAEALLDKATDRDSANQQCFFDPVAAMPATLLHWIAGVGAAISIKISSSIAPERLS